MKYIITESRIKNIIFKYLDDKLNGFEKMDGKYLDIVLALPGEEYGLMGWERPDTLYVYLEIVDEIKLMFSMTHSDALNVISRYFESRHNLKVNDITNPSMKVSKLLRVDS
jgi:hypothetical protein